MDLMTLSTKSNKTPLHKWQFEALGTSWSVETPGRLSSDVREVIITRLQAYDKTYSRFRDDSLVWQLRSPGEYEFPEDLAPLLRLYEKLHTLTGGHMTPLIGRLLEEAGYDASYSFRKTEFSEVPEFGALNWDGDRMLRPRQPIVLDVGAAGKGQLVDILAAILENNNVEEYTIDASGDIKHRGSMTTIGLEHPADVTKIVGTAKLQNQSLCASAINRRIWGNMHHMFNPRTKTPTNTMLATWVVADSTMLADALATALFFVSPEVLQDEFDFKYVSISMMGAIDVSPDFEGELFI